MTSILIVGIGNDYRRDDGVGLVVARALKAYNLPNTTVIETREAGAGLIELWTGADAVLIVDAVRSGATPGFLYAIDAHIHALPPGLTAYSSHAFGLAKTIELARVLKRLPPALLVYGIEGKEFGLGTGLSPAVERSVPALVAQLVQHLRMYTSPNG